MIRLPMPRPPLPSARLVARQRGFTLIELVITITLIGIVAGMLTSSLGKPISGLMNQIQRAELSARADVPLRQMARDVRSAVPNSVRTGAASGGQNKVLEFIRATRSALYLPNRSTLVGGLSFDSPGSGGNPNPTGNCVTAALAGNACNVFYVFGDVSNGTNAFNARAIVVSNTGSASSLQNGMNAYSRTPRDVVAATSNAWEKAHTITPANSTIVFNSFDGTYSKLTVTLPGAATWQLVGQEMPEHRLYFADEIVHYECVANAGTGRTELRRYTYSINAIGEAVQTAAALGLANPEVLVDNVSSCDFNASTGGGFTSAFAAGLARLQLGIQAENLESITLQREVFIENPP